MSHAIVYASRTGNTARLAERARELLGPEGCLWCGGAEAGAIEAARAADLVLLGSWTDKGGLDPALGEVVSALAGKCVFLFGTCGFGGSEEYYARVLANFEAALPESAEVVGRFCCQGQMPAAVRERYVALGEKDPQRAAAMVENFDHALGHPDDADLAAFGRSLAAAGLVAR